MSGSICPRLCPIQSLEANLQIVLDRVDNEIASVSSPYHRVPVQKLPLKIKMLKMAKEIFKIYQSDKPSDPLERVASKIDALMGPFFTWTKKRNPLFPRNKNPLEMVKTFDKVATLAINTMETVTGLKKEERFPGTFQISKFDVDFLKNMFCHNRSEEFKPSIINGNRSVVSFYQKGDFRYVLKEVFDPNVKGREAANLCLIGDARAIQGGIVLQLMETALVNGIEEVTKPLVFVMEYAEAGDLYDFALKEDFTREVFLEGLRNIAGLCKRIHKRGCLHKDLKAENALLVKGRKGRLVTKITDFEFCAPPRAGEVKGTMKNFPLEAFTNHKAVTVQTGPFTDIWSFGILVFGTLTLIDVIECKERDSEADLKAKVLRVVRQSEPDLQKYIQHKIELALVHNQDRLEALDPEGFLNGVIDDCLKREGADRILTEKLSEKFENEVFKFEAMKAALLADQCRVPPDFFDEKVS